MECFSFFMMGLHSFDRATSNGMEDSVGDDRKSSEKCKRKRHTVRISCLNVA
jgi:hypothetical protein